MNKSFLLNTFFFSLPNFDTIFFKRIYRLKVKLNPIAIWIGTPEPRTDLSILSPKRSLGA